MTVFEYRDVPTAVCVAVARKDYDAAGRLCVKLDQRTLIGVIAQLAQMLLIVATQPARPDDDLLADLLAVMAPTAEDRARIEELLADTQPAGSAARASRLN